MSEIDDLKKEVATLRRELDLLYYLLTNKYSSSLSNPVLTAKKIAREKLADYTHTQRYLLGARISLSNARIPEVIEYFTTEVKKLEHQEATYRLQSAYFDRVANTLETKIARINYKIENSINNKIKENEKVKANAKK